MKTGSKQKRGISAREVHDFLAAAESSAQKLEACSTVVQFFRHANPNNFPEIKLSKKMMWRNVLKAALNFFYCSGFYSTFSRDLAKTYPSSSSLNMAVLLGVSERSAMLLRDVELRAVQPDSELPPYSPNITDFLEKTHRRQKTLTPGSHLFPFHKNICLKTTKIYISDGEVENVAAGLRKLPGTSFVYVWKRLTEEFEVLAGLKSVSSAVSEVGEKLNYAKQAGGVLNSTGKTGPTRGTVYLLFKAHVKTKNDREDLEAMFSEFPADPMVCYVIFFADFGNKKFYKCKAGMQNLFFAFHDIEGTDDHSQFEQILDHFGVFPGLVSKLCSILPDFTGEKQKKNEYKKQIIAFFKQPRRDFCDEQWYRFFLDPRLSEPWFSAFLGSDSDQKTNRSHCVLHTGPADFKDAGKKFINFVEKLDEGTIFPKNTSDSSETDKNYRNSVLAGVLFEKIQKIH